MRIIVYLFLKNTKSNLNIYLTTISDDKRRLLISLVFVLKIFPYLLETQIER